MKCHQDVTHYNQKCIKTDHKEMEMHENMLYDLKEIKMSNMRTRKIHLQSCQTVTPLSTFWHHIFYQFKSTVNLPGRVPPPWMLLL